MRERHKAPERGPDRAAAQNDFTFSKRDGSKRTRLIVDLTRFQGFVVLSFRM